MEPFKILDFDSHLFGLLVAKVIPESLDVLQLGELLSELKKKGVSLVYWCSKKEDTASQLAACEYRGFLADEKLTYVVNLPSIKDQFQNQDFQFYSEFEPSADLENLAFISGQYSRFLKDPRIGLERFQKMYATWIRNSCNHRIAKAVLIINENKNLLGMATLGEKESQGDIGLLAVFPQYHGRGIGTQLVRKAQAYFFDNKYPYAQVVTQKDNIPACRLYEKCNFMIDSFQNFYHFWL